MNIRAFKLAIVSVLLAVTAVACSPSSKISLPTSTATPISTPTLTATASATGAPSAVPSTITTAATQPADDQGAAQCATYQNHLYEVCFAYVVNDAHGSLQPYYKYVHSDSVLSGLKNRLALKYHDQALQVIERRAANWPKGTNTVDGPDITILTACSSLDNNRAVLTTRENWTVRAPSGAVLYPENGQVHTVVLRRIPDERFRYGNQVLHQWVVYELYDGVQNVPAC